ncbi:MAG: hypothetical protein US69_C0008G0024 [candidate division TM6 bacterium GW2011_GWF2_38_10]|nr:MAG: hypothetical protein US69_C0008G0024 [candidate division TM6 bacterium GW2011_GWF2_38_10]
MDVNNSLQSFDLESIAQPELGTRPAQSRGELMSFKFISMSSHLMRVRVEINQAVVALVYDQTVLFFKRKKIEGFDYQAAPKEFLEETFGPEIAKKIKAFFLHHHVIDGLMQELVAQKIPYANQPRLANVEYVAGKSLFFFFDVSLTDPFSLKEWRDFSFKASRRKRYKDLDKQVMQFMDQESVVYKKREVFEIEASDWVGIEACLLDEQEQSLSAAIKSFFWIKIKPEDLSDQISSLLYGKCVGDSFVTQALDLEEYSNDESAPYYNFCVTVISIVKGSHFSVELFKQTYRLKNKNDVHNKLMEVFSFRNELSQRKTTIEDMFGLFMSKHRFEIPKHLIIRRQESILDCVVRQADYQIYRSQPDFHDSIELLAEKQLREEVLMDQIAYQENISVEVRDMHQYLHLFNHRRLKEFVYFKPSIDCIDEHTPPINASLLEEAVLREKTLNYVLHVLTH